jgi:Domain of unknown function (DUF4390)
VPKPTAPVRRPTLQDPTGLLGLWGQVLLLLLAIWATAPAQAQGVELALLQTSRSEASLNLDFAARITLPKAVEDAMQRGVPIYFVADALLLRSRWYWRDERVARVSRSWRVAYQPLTGSWRVGFGGLNQTYPTLAEALVVVSRSAGWKLADVAQLDGDKNYRLEFSYRLDSSQLPGPMQFGLGGQGDWAVGVSRVLKVEP